MHIKVRGLTVIEASEILDKMKNQKINYDKVLRKMIQHWEREGERPRILLHSCCAPCSTYTLEFLTEYADIAFTLRIQTFILKMNICVVQKFKNNLSKILINAQGQM